jgi:CRP-like cAMP-binding protein/predicted GNAT family N-acyltransferase
MANPIEPGPAPILDAELLQPFCKRTRFESGDPLRQKGQYYRDMFLVTDGLVEVDLQSGNGVGKLVVSGAGTPIGEIGFLRGCSATATVTAKTAVSALVIDDDVLGRLEREQPTLASQLLHHLAETAEERISFNLTLTSTAGTCVGAQAIDVYMCRNSDMLESAKRLRYEVYCGELGRNSPYADHDKKTISDELDRFGNTFIAVADGETIGTLRANLSSEGSLGHLEDLYGMRRSDHHPHATGVCTKFIVKKSRRGGPAAVKLISALSGFGIRSNVAECYIDCVPALVPYYKAMGFTIAGQKFFHRENGPSYPMVVDFAKHGKRLSREGGARDYLKLFAKAEAIRLVDRLRDYGRPAPQPEARQAH